MSLVKILSFESLPRASKEVAELIGVSTLLILAENFSGKKLYIPKNPKTTHRLARILSEEQFKILCFYYGGDWLRIPVFNSARNQLRDREICEEVNKGISLREIARKQNLTVNYLRKILRQCHKEAG